MLQYLGPFANGWIPCIPLYHCIIIYVFGDQALQRCPARTQLHKEDDDEMHDDVLDVAFEVPDIEDDSDSDSEYAYD